MARQRGGQRGSHTRQVHPPQDKVPVPNHVLNISAYVATNYVWQGSGYGAAWICINFLPGSRTALLQFIQ